MSDTTAEHKRLVRKGIEAVNRRDAETLRDIFAANVALQGPRERHGREAVIEDQINRPVFPNRQFVIDELIAEGNVVAALLTFTGLTRPPFSGSSRPVPTSRSN